MTPSEKSILVVDDVVDWQTTLRGILADEGFQVQVADSRDDALRRFLASTFDLVVADVRLIESSDDDTSGLSLARELKILDPAIKIILITGYETRTTIDAAYTPGEDGQRVIEDFVSKTQTDKLVGRVHELLQS